MPGKIKQQLAKDLAPQPPKAAEDLAKLLHAGDAPGRRALKEGTKAAAPPAKAAAPAGQAAAPPAKAAAPAAKAAAPSRAAAPAKAAAPARAAKAPAKAAASSSPSSAPASPVIRGTTTPTAAEDGRCGGVVLSSKSALICFEGVGPEN